MRKVVIGLSGGMDSATLLGLLLEQGYEVHCCSFMYGSKHGDYEFKAATDIVGYYTAEWFIPVYQYGFDLRQVFSNLSSNLLQSGGEIPEGNYDEDSMKKTVVPGRNLIFASVMAGLAESIGASHVALGVHSGDHHIYPDCRPPFINALRETIGQSSDGKVSVLTPFIDDDKESILRIGYSLHPPVPYHLTRTCYKDQQVACGRCGSCRERLEAFEKIGVKDPVKYE